VFPPLPLHFVQGKCGGLRCDVPPGLRTTDNLVHADLKRQALGFTSFSVKAELATDSGGLAFQPGLN
jgi:hypothetical protein